MLVVHKVCDVLKVVTRVGGVAFVHPRLRHLRRLGVQQALQRFSVAITIHIRKSYFWSGMTKAAL